MGKSKQKYLKSMKNKNAEMILILAEMVYHLKNKKKYLMNVLMNELLNLLV